MIHNYPTSAQEIAVWARQNGTTVEEARHRFAQYAALCAIVSVATLRQGLVFKGGNALDLVWYPNRSTLDLDFSLDHGDGDVTINVETIRFLFERGFGVVKTRFGSVFAVNSVRQQPPGKDKTFITFIARVGYGLPDQRQLLLRMSSRETSPQMLPIEISINEPIGGTIVFAINEGLPLLRVSTLEEIVGEKLRALLQQPIRRRNRRQDVLDIAAVIGFFPDLNLSDIAKFLLLKAKARDVIVSRSAFRHPDIAAMSRIG